MSAEWTPEIAAQVAEYLALLKSCPRGTLPASKLMEIVRFVRRAGITLSGRRQSEDAAGGTA